MRKRVHWGQNLPQRKRIGKFLMNMAINPIPATPEFHRPYPVDGLCARNVREHLVANGQECAALSKRFDLIAIKALKAEVELHKAVVGEMVAVKGRFTATVVQRCVVTLEPLESELSESFQAYFTHAENIAPSEDLALEEAFAPEAIDADGTVDLGELVAQNLALALNPYSRREGVVFDAGVLNTNSNGAAAAKETAKEKAMGEKPNPFAILAEYRAKKSR